MDLGLNSVETHKNGTIFHGEKRTDKAPLGEKEEGQIVPSNSEISLGYLSPIRRTFLAYSKGFPSERALPKNFEDNPRARRKSATFVKSHHQKRGSKSKLHRSNSDCTCASQGFEIERGISCPKVDITR